MSFKRIIISGGGTGGHIFPALAIAGEVKKRSPDCNILFVGALGRMEMERIPSAGYEIIGLPVTGLPRKVGISMLKFVVRLLKSYRMALKIIDSFKPQVVIGVGGFASGPVLRAATHKGIPSLIQEQNSYAGITNKLLGKNANVICVAFDGMDRYFPSQKIVITGNPVREILLKIPEEEHVESYFGIKNDKRVILILGGSQGARSLNDTVMNNLPVIAGSDVEFIWQTGSLYYQGIINRLKERVPPNLHIFEFISKMDFAYALQGVVISRAGAGTIAELCLTGKPAILVPSPNVAEDHQTKNALALVEKGAALMIPDNEIDEKLIPEALRLVSSPGECRKLSERIKKLAKPDATGQIVDEAEKLL